MTCLPPERVKSPVCEAMTLIFGLAAMASAKPFLRSIAGAEPVVPCSSTMFTGSVWPCVLLDQPLAGLLALLDEVRAEEGLVQRRVRGVDGAVGEDHRDVGAAWPPAAPCPSRSRPPGEKAMTSTFCWM